MQKKKDWRPLLIAALTVVLGVGRASGVHAHCDTLGGPVVSEARQALEQGEIAPLLKWVRAGDEAEIRAAFRKTLAVRDKGREARELADMYFFETLVRVHRAGEGEPYAGLQPEAAVDPAVALADRALQDGSAEELVEVLTKALADGIRLRFALARESRKRAADSVAAGREFVESYVVFTHYIEGLHRMITGGMDHHGEGDGGAADAHGH